MIYTTELPKDSGKEHTLETHGDCYCTPTIEKRYDAEGNWETTIIIHNDMEGLAEDE